MDKIREMIEARKSRIYERLSSDKSYANDPIVGRFMEGKVIAQTEEFNFYEKLLQEIDNL